jgi:hypothetical protein
MEQGAGEVHFDFTLRVELDRRQVLEPLLRGLRIGTGVIGCRHDRQAEDYPIVESGFADRGLSTDAPRDPAKS